MTLGRRICHRLGLLFCSPRRPRPASLDNKAERWWHPRSLLETEDSTGYRMRTVRLDDFPDHKVLGTYEMVKNGHHVVPTYPSTIVLALLQCMRSN